MLGKLVKYEWKGTYKVCGLILACVAAFTVLGCLSLKMPALDAALKAVENGGSTGTSFGVLDGMAVLTLVLYVLALVGASYGILIYLGVHFYKSMYSDEGYLTHTLPVTANQLLISKILVGGIWMILVLLAIVASIVALFSAFLGMYLQITPVEIFQEFGAAMAELFGEAGEVLRVRVIHLAVILIITCVAGSFCSIAMLFGSITMGQLFSKYRALMAIVCYIGVYILNTILGSVVQMPFTVSFMMQQNAPHQNDVWVLDYYNNIFDVSFLLTLVMGAVLYFAARMILVRKFDLE
ncbi:MAG TPA: hypothetical protein H9742_11065 [Candidatus Acetatifactor stercoripullorum]|uniref:Uncharacterized protein n=1 Tax=Candidatus Acetatifactor stercoripullorum TaxID=2838414 RepID=A0A9D1UBT3_9FIRM|nr:hypothetical protein [uncultured Acetatifactor sp.]HIW82032.1 hypothetical protein [Candidatus Acetatifactor stercoripullorum]